MWWSPCPSRECPEEEELDIIVDQCLDHCLLLEQNPKIEILQPPTNSPVTQPPIGKIDDINFHVKKNHARNKSMDMYSSTTESSPDGK